MKSASKDQLSVVYNSESPLKKPAVLLAEIFHGVIGSRELIWILFVRDIKAQYRESILGYFWLFVSPVTTMLVWLFLNSQRIVRVETEIPYPIFLLIGTTVWASFASSITAPLGAFNSTKPIFMKLKVPPEAFIIAGLLRSLFDVSLRVLLLVPIFIIVGHVPPVEAFLFPIGIIVLVLMAFSVGLALIPIGSFYGDIGSAAGLAVGLLMYTAPVVFPIPKNDGLLATVMNWNPTTPVIEFCRSSLTTGNLGMFPEVMTWAAVSLVLIFFALIVLRVAMPNLVSRMGM